MHHAARGLTPVADSFHAVDLFPDPARLFLVEQQPPVHLFGSAAATFADDSL